MKKRYVVQDPDAMRRAELVHEFGLENPVTGAKHIRFPGNCCLQYRVVFGVANHLRKRVRQFGERTALAQERRVPFNLVGRQRPETL